MASIFGGADAHHVLVIQRLVVHVAGDVLLLQAADAVFESRCARERPTGAPACPDRACRAGNLQDRVANFTGMPGISSTFGMRQGSAPLAR